MSKSEAYDRESGSTFMPYYDAAGLISAIVTHHETNEVLMLAHMNSDAVQLTLSTGEAHFYSRSRGEIWHKGGTSGNVLVIHEIKVDCDQDALWLSVTPQGHGAACHTGRISCFYRQIIDHDGVPSLKMTGDAPLFDPDKIYQK